MNETIQRFFAEIADQVGYHRVAEIHLFPAATQGGIESGLAVVAADPETTSTHGVARHVVYTARYRHTRKGPDRGRWDVDVTAEADAPLVTVDAVVRGVVRRSGEECYPERISGEQFRAIVPAPAAVASQPASPTPLGTPLPDSASE